jgi:O-antigen/teichoic acid export membrane protein
MTDAAPLAATAPRRRLVVDLLAAYAATIAKVVAWAAVSALLYRHAGRDAFATFALVRATLGILNYVTLGLAPALLHRLPALDASDPSAARATLAAARQLLALAAVAGVALTGLAALVADRWLSVGSVPATAAALMVGLAMTARLCSDGFGAVLQSRGRLALDNVLQAGADLAWVALLLGLPRSQVSIDSASLLLLLAYGGLLVVRAALASTGRAMASPADPFARRWLLRFGLVVTLAQVADFLYAPVAHWLIRAFVRPPSVLADYSAAVQIDAALLLAVAGIGTVLLPRSAAWLARGSVDRVRTAYVLGTAFAAALLAMLAVLVLLLADPILRLWFDDPMPGTQTLLPWVLVHTVVGGTAVTGRAVLLAAGRVRALTVSALLAGAGNVLLGLALVTLTPLGARAVVLATIVVVTLRCLVWMPWYVLRTLREIDPLRSPPASSGSAAGR